jgi:MoaA/NifB/PqqE/SkfB family radical SAM enzyme
VSKEPAIWGNVGRARAEPAPELIWKLWIYTNYDCNLSCSYCVAESTPQAPRRGLDLETVWQLVDEAVALDFQEVFLTGGEPFILRDIYAMLAYASDRLPTTVLTNGMLLRGKRLDQLADVASDRLVVQVSLDGARPEHHDPHRGQGSWAGAVEGLQALRERGLRVRVSATITPANQDHLDELRAFCAGLGIEGEDLLIRPTARRGFAREGLEVGVETLVPEVTATIDGIFWHPLASPDSCDLQVTRTLFPLAEAVSCIQRQYGEIVNSRGERPTAVT